MEQALVSQGSSRGPGKKLEQNGNCSFQFRKLNDGKAYFIFP
jgi:hypothetical protein